MLVMGRWVNINKFEVLDFCGHCICADLRGERREKKKKGELVYTCPQNTTNYEKLHAQSIRKRNLHFEGESNVNL